MSKTSTEGTETSTVLYPSGGYSVEGSEKTIYVSGPQGASATIHYNGTSYAVSSNHQDHLGSTAVVTNSSGELKELLDYNPYGTERLHTGASSTSALPSDEAQKTYIGEYSDDDSGLSYLNARYYDAARGQFLSEDPAQYSMLPQIMGDPQQLNFYSYSRSNPLKYVDTTGETPTLVIGAVVGAVMGFVSEVIADSTDDQKHSFSEYVGATVSGTVSGVLVGSGAGLVASAAGGFVGGVSGKVTEQTIDEIQNSQVDNFSIAEILVEGAEEAVGNMIPGPDIPGVTVGSNSFKAIESTVETKLTNGTIENISTSTAIKITTVKVVEQSTTTGATGLYTGLINQVYESKK